MKEASTYLFEDLYEGRPLFKSQLDLVNQLLNDENNPYYIGSKDADQYSKAQSRLKTYISQLLSHSANRNITEDFKRGLIQLIEKKIDTTKYNVEELVVSLILALKNKNSRITKTETKNTIKDQLTYDLSEASYIAIITSKPLEIDIQNETIFFSLRNFLFKDLLDRLSDVNKDLKIYRFNFPLDTYCYLFWRGLKRILKNYINENITTITTLFDSLYEKFALKTATLIELEKKSEYTDRDINELVNEILKGLYRNRYILVFNTTAPIYGMPLIILNPTDQRNMKVYTLLQDEKEGINIFKYPEQDCVLWRVFVWDKLKSKNLAGVEIPYSDDI